MALQNGYDDEDWQTWGNVSSPTTEPNAKKEISNSYHSSNDTKHDIPNKENKLGKDSERTIIRRDDNDDKFDNHPNNDGKRGGYSNNDTGRERSGYSNTDSGRERSGYSNTDSARERGGYRNNDSGRERSDTERRNHNDRDSDKRKPRNEDLTDDFQSKAKINDDGHSRTFYRGNKDGEKEDGNNDEAPVAKRATYIPNDDAEDYALHVNSGINFDNYEKIPVEVTGENIPKSINKFSEINMPDFLVENIASMKYTKLTPVQKYAIPIIEAGRDLMACAQTGSGKTVAFLLPIIESLFKNKVETESSTAQVAFPKALIMAPTRELCRQIFTAARQLCKGSDLKCAYIYGGIEMNRSRRNLQESGCDILVATPGRLIHFLELVWVSLRYLRYFVLDEGDRMLDKDGFYESVEKISGEANFTGENRKIQISMFSATFPSEIQNLAKNLLKNYLFLAVGMVGSANSDVKQEIIRADQKDKMALAIEYMKTIPNEKTLIFVQSKRMADFFGIKLDYLGYKATTIHGDREQEQRETALNDFKSGRCNFMVATNVAARGLDIPMVDTVVNVDMPDDIDTYVHRIGRTGRCGNVGRAVSFFDENNDLALAGPLIHRLQEANQQVPEWLLSLSGGGAGGATGNRRQGAFVKDNRRDMKVSKFVDRPNSNSFMKGTNADYNTAAVNDDQADW